MGTKAALAKRRRRRFIWLWGTGSSVAEAARRVGVTASRGYQYLEEIEAMRAAAREPWREKNRQAAESRTSMRARKF